MFENVWMFLEMAVNGCKWLEMAANSKMLVWIDKMSWNFWKWLEMARRGSKWLELANMTWNDLRKLERARHLWKLKKVPENGWKGWKQWWWQCQWWWGWWWRIKWVIVLLGCPYDRFGDWLMRGYGDWEIGDCEISGWVRQNLVSLYMK